MEHTTKDVTQQVAAPRCTRARVEYTYFKHLNKNKRVNFENVRDKTF